MRPATLGVVGTLVWDRLVGRGAGESTVEEWGGLAYTLAALSAALPEGWRIDPIVKVGGDLAAEADRFLDTVPGIAGAGPHVVPEPNNRVELTYVTDAERTERLTGGVPPWTWGELAPRVAACDALHVNFVSGYEMDLETARSLRDAFDGPVWADLHSLFLGRDELGVRIPRPLDRAGAWIACFDAVQLNEVELALLAGSGDPWAVASRAVGTGTALVAVTRGGAGAALVAAEDLDSDPLTWRVGGAGRSRPRIVTVPTRPREGDPTGCGDVWGGACFGRLLAGDGLEEAAAEANRYAGAKMARRGAGALAELFNARRSG